MYVVNSSPTMELQGGGGVIKSSISPPPLLNDTVTDGSTANTSTLLSGSKFQVYLQVHTRINSFYSGTQWPRGKKQTVQQMAHAGFFFSGVGECVICFHCGVEINDWLTDDIPVDKHKMLSPGCDYVNKLLTERDQQILFGFEDDSKYALEEPTVTREPPAWSKPLNRKAKVDCIKQKPCGQALNVLQLPDELINETIQQVLSENDWDESKVTGKLLADKAIDLQDEWEQIESHNKNQRHEQFTGKGKTLVNGKTLVKGKTLAKGKTSKNIAGKWNTPDNRNTSNKDLTLGESQTDVVQFLPNHDLTKQQLSDENRKLKQSLSCKICMDMEVKVIYIPCGHMVTCEECYSTQRKCPICRKRIITNIKASFGVNEQQSQVLVH